MPRFRIVPSDQSYPSAEISSLDPSAVLHIVERLGCHEARVLSDGQYRFSVDLSDSGVWRIFQREHQAEAQIIPLAGRGTLQSWR